MAEKGLRRALSSSLHSDDLLSDVELLPGSDPPTPGQQVPCSLLATPYSSKVTTQLYASLQQSRQAEALASSRLEGQHGSALARKAMEADVDLDTLAEELSHRLSAGVEASSFRQVRKGLLGQPTSRLTRQLRQLSISVSCRAPWASPATFRRWRTCGVTCRACCGDPEMCLVRLGKGETAWMGCEMKG